MIRGRFLLRHRMFDAGLGTFRTTFPNPIQRYDKNFIYANFLHKKMKQIEYLFYVIEGMDDLGCLHTKGIEHLYNEGFIPASFLCVCLLIGCKTRK